MVAACFDVSRAPGAATTLSSQFESGLSAPPEKGNERMSMDTARVIQVIETTLLRRGDGKDTPLRGITQYWSLDGKLLAEVDPIREAHITNLSTYSKSAK